MAGGRHYDFLGGEELFAELAERRLGAGRNRPISIYARADGGDAVQCVVKPSNRLTMPPLEYLFEWLGSVFAVCLGLETPRAHLVRIDRDFSDSIIDPDLQADMSKSLGLVFGSEYVADGYTQLVPNLTLSKPQREAAAMVLAFDAFIHNVDRRRGPNPNLFANRSGFLVFDHEAAFSFVLPILGAPPPETDTVDDIVDHHVFRTFFGSRGPDFAPFRVALEELDDPLLDAIEAHVPAEWTIGPAQGKITEIMRVLRARRDAVDTWLPAVQARATK